MRITPARLATLGPLLVAALLAAGCIGAVQTEPESPQGFGDLKPTVADRDAGFVGIRPGFDLKRYRILLVAPPTVAEPGIKDAEDKKLASAMPTYFQSELVRRMREAGLFERVVNLTETEFKPEGQPRALRLEPVLTRLAPGNRALRYLVGFGAGRSKAQVEMKLTDVETGQVMLVTADRRVAAYGFFGGDSEDHLKESYDDIARDLGKLLARLARGEGPTPPTR